MGHSRITRRIVLTVALIGSLLAIAVPAVPTAQAKLDGNVTPAARTDVADAVDRYLRNHVQAPAVVDGRSPDTKDAREAAQRPSPAGEAGFDWSAAGVGAGATVGALFFAGSILLLGRARRRQMSTA